MSPSTSSAQAASWPSVVWDKEESVFQPAMRLQDQLRMKGPWEEGRLWMAPLEFRSILYSHSVAVLERRGVISELEPKPPKLEDIDQCLFCGIQMWFMPYVKEGEVWLTEANGKPLGKVVYERDGDLG